MSTGRFMVRLVVAVVAAAGVALIAASPSQASRFVTLSAPASSGYEFGLSARAKPGKVPAGLQFDRAGAGLQSLAFYSKRKAGGYDKRRLRSNFGQFGSARARFFKREVKRRKYGVGPCRIRIVERIGVFRGRIQFTAEDGFSDIRTRRADGRITSYRLRGCRGKSATRAKRSLSPLAQMRAKPKRRYELSSCGPADGSTLSADREPGGSEFYAESIERTGGILISRYILSSANRAAFKVAKGGRRAMVRPPRGFDGTGRFRNGVLDGNLQADFPGAPNTPLTPGEGVLRTGGSPGIRPRCP